MTGAATGTVTVSETTASAESWVRIRGVDHVVLLAGDLVLSDLERRSGLSTLDLPITPDQTVLEFWVRSLLRLHSPKWETTRVSVSLSPASPLSAEAARLPAGSAHVEADAFRGGAGLLRDRCEGDEEGATILAIEAGRWFGGALAPLIGAHAVRGADITVAANPDGSPGGLYMLSRRALEVVPPRGFMDLREQWINAAVRAGLSVVVHQLPAPGCLRIATLRDLLGACRQANLVSGEGSLAHPWRVVCPGAEVEPGVTIADSVVMPGARVGAGATIVRSLLRPGTRVQAGEAVADRVA